MIGVIADDLTGAAELGAIGLRLGLRADILLRPFNPRHTSELRTKSAPDLLCLDTDSRFCSATEASRRAAAAARFLRKAGATFIYKKTDSVLRGQVAAEIQPIMRELDLKLAVLVPANPSLGRTIRDGHYYVHGKPIHKTDFARDPAHPRKSSLVTDLLHRPKGLPIFVGHPDFPLPDFGILIGNVAKPADLQQWAILTASTMLPAGGAEFFAALLAGANRPPPRSPPRSRPRKLDIHHRKSRIGTELFICGSTSQSTLDFISAQRQFGTPLFSLPPDLAKGARLTLTSSGQIAVAAVAALRSHRRVVLHVGLPLIRRPSLAKTLSSQLVRIALLILKSARVEHIFVEGGATAVELLRAMRLRRLTVLRELAPGVATLAVNSNLLVTMKPGSYHWPL
jgi:uncharacterized protein YgbK (DUF1537 family)